MNISSRQDYFDCGVATLSGLYADCGDKGAEAEIRSILGKGKYAFFIMADAKPKDPRNTLAQSMKTYIEENDLGTMIESDGWHYNEAHGPNYIKIYIFRPDYDSESMKRFLEEKKLEKKKDMMRL